MSKMDEIQKLLDKKIYARSLFLLVIFMILSLYAILVYFPIELAFIPATFILYYLFKIINWIGKQHLVLKYITKHRKGKWEYMFSNSQQKVLIEYGKTLDFFTKVSKVDNEGKIKIKPIGLRHRYKFSRISSNDKCTLV